MVAEILMLLALAAAAPEGGSAARAEARATATIVRRAVTLQNGVAVTRTGDVAPVRQKPRDCAPADKGTPDCRLIVYDLP